MIVSANLSEIVLQLFRDSGGKKVMLCNAEGEILAHAGSVGAIDEATGDALAQLIAEVFHGATEGRLPATKDLVATVPGGLPGGMSVCATAIEGRAALVVVFDQTTTLERVRLKVRRARELLGKTLPRDAAASDPKPEPS